MENIIEGRIMVGILLGTFMGVFLILMLVLPFIQPIINLAKGLSFSKFDSFVNYKPRNTLGKRELLKIADKRFENMHNSMLKNINIEEIDSLRNKLIKQIESIEKKEKKKFKIILGTILSTMSIIILLASILMVLVDPLWGPILIFIGSIMLVGYVKLCEKNKKSNADIKRFEDDIKNYKALYEKKVIPEFLRQFEEKIKYNRAETMPREIYDMAKFEMYDTYESEDMMDITLKNDCRAKMSEVLTLYTTKDRDGHVFYHMLFSGIFALIETPKKFKEELYVKQDKDLTVRSIIPECEKIQLDSSEFEQFFDIYGTNKIVAMQLLTADIMQMFIDFRKDTGISFEFAIKNNRIFLRFEGGGLFEIPNLEKTLWDKDIMYRDYKILDFTFELTYKITKLLEETEY